VSQVLRTTNWSYLAFLVLLFVAVSLFWATPFLYPLTILTTIFHELSHGLAAILSGGAIDRLIINANGSGVAFTRGGSQLLIAPAGYLGATLIGGALLFTARWRTAGRFVLYALTAILLVTTVLWIRNGFGIFFTLLLAAGFAGVAWRAPVAVIRYLNPLVAVALLRFAIDDAWGLLRFTGSGQVNDAVILERATGIPAVVSATVWTLLTLAISLLALYVVTRRAPAERAPTPVRSAAGDGDGDRPAAPTSAGALDHRSLLKQLESEGLLESESRPRSS
jgi:hypothetical protein